MNDSGEKLLQFCVTNDLKIMNTFFEQKKPQRKWTWTSPDGKTHNLIDYIIINKRWSSNVTNCRSFDAHIGSDHKLVKANLKMRLRRGIRPTENMKYDTKKLTDQNIRQKYEDEIEKNIQISDQDNMEVMWTNIQNGFKTAANNIVGRACKKPKDKWISDEVLELVEKRRNLAKQQTNTADRKQFNWLTREIRRKLQRTKTTGWNNNAKKLRTLSR